MTWLTKLLMLFALSLSAQAFAAAPVCDDRKCTPPAGWSCIGNSQCMPQSSFNNGAEFDNDNNCISNCSYPSGADNAIWVNPSSGVPQFLIDSWGATTDFEKAVSKAKNLGLLPAAESVLFADMERTMQEILIVILLIGVGYLQLHVMLWFTVKLFQWLGA